MNVLETPTSRTHMLLRLYPFPRMEWTRLRLNRNGVPSLGAYIFQRLTPDLKGVDIKISISIPT